jgi:hypothetical protein
MSQESRDFAGEMYGLEAQLNKDDFNIWEEKTGKIWRNEMDNPQDWEEAYRNNIEQAFVLMNELKNLI